MAGKGVQPESGEGLTAGNSFGETAVLKVKSRDVRSEP